NGNTYVIELKVAYKPEDVPVKLTEAVEQMESKNYLAPYPDAIGLAMVIDDTQRQITETEVINSTFASFRMGNSEKTV
ncbi:MAG: PD-(D/E)XK nuclease domain-containing protein, partial [Prevotellaceae bacterium]|nr:PD-(D/E)XK nuclease domain-containing protein [Prevotellaceae bacterium]